jgi:hypothetical protein
VTVPPSELLRIKTTRFALYQKQIPHLRFRIKGHLTECLSEKGPECKKRG